VLFRSETGIAIPIPDPTLIADEIELLIASREKIKHMGSKAQALAFRYNSPQRNASALHDLYRRVLGA